VEPERQAVEFFHLSFLRVLSTHPQRENCVLKGGCNLRFFFGSPRYSEDIDLDVRIASPTTFKHAVERILGGPQLARILAARGLKLAHINGDKQTATTQRWKLGLQQLSTNTILPTRLDFSRRAAEGQHVVESVDATVLKQHQLPPPLLVHHYDGAAAIRQKVAALADRSSVQARDVFDLNLLLAKVIKLPVLSRDLARKAARRALELSHREFIAMVVAYLPDDERATYEPGDAWEAIQLHVSEQIEALAK
jgi:predicted nucleotidyltransferase component of viral defense system